MGCILGLAWAQSFSVRALLEGRGGQGPIQVELRAPSEQVYVLRGELKEGQATFPLPEKNLTCEAVLSAPGYLPVRVAGPLTLLDGSVIDFTDPKALHPKSAFVEKMGKAYLAAGELGALPDEPFPVINAYDYELFLQALQSGDSRADFNGDGKIDAADAQLLLKNQDKLLTTEL